MANVTVTMLQSGRTDDWGRPLVAGSTYSLDFDRAKSLWRAGFASVADPAVFDDDNTPVAGGLIRHLRFPGFRKSVLASLATSSTASREVITEDRYLDQNEKATHTMTRKQMPRHLAQQDKRGRAMTDAKTFKPNPNMFTCKWCPYGPDKQGDCKFGVSAIPQPKPVVKSLVFTNKPSKSDALF